MKNELIEILKQFKWLSIGLIIPIWKFFNYLKDRRGSKKQKISNDLQSIQPRFEEYSSETKTNGNEWTLYFINKGSMTKSIELEDPLGEFLKPDVKREVKTEVPITLEGNSAKKIQQTKDIPPYQAVLKYQNLENNTYHQNIIRAQGCKPFYIEQPVLIK
ncbi:MULTISPECIES: hypothetical protein [Reichenbachiella]|uniref:hypothetical protein n=1 Tax=Reichenbachiella TaxID=156993 RepID=UPI000E6BB753|nr:MULTISPECIES: hypothetical protein [Reichenbachiella]MBU2914362.1 hypothetical protein [Reichenbachiella agariperforans]RJE73080.1 hypothetical protein BGP76_03830 [Reichenbachiella sp. MSK19-1]